MSEGTLALHCDRQHFLTAIQAADAVVPANSTKPILTNLLLDAKTAHLEVVATDQQVSLRCVVRRVEVRAPGQAVVSARQIAAIIKESSSATVSLELQSRGDTRVLHVELADGEYDIPAVVGETLPPVSAFPADVAPFAIAGARFEEMLRQTAFAMDKDRTSAVLSGLQLAIGGGELVCAATDGKVLGEAVERGEAFAMADGGTVQAVLPNGVVAHLQRIIGAAKPAQVEIAFAGRTVFARLAMDDGLQAELSGRLVEGTFPSYRGALAVTGNPTVGFATAELSSAVRRAALMTNQTSRGIVLTLDPGRAVFSNLNYTNGSVRIPVSCAYEGPTVKLGLNAHYLSDVLRAYRSERITIEMGRGLVMRESGVTYLIMPISLPT